MGSFLTAIILSAPALSQVPDWDKEMNSNPSSTLPSSLRKEPQGFGFGIFSGSPVGLAGLALSYRHDKSTQQIIFSGSSADDSFQFSFDQLWRIYPSRFEQNLSFPLSVGFGAWGKINDTADPGIFNNDRIQDKFGLRLPLNMMTHNKNVAIDVYAELALSLQLLPSFEVGGQGGVGARFYFF